MQYRLYKSGDFEKLYALEEICFQPPHRFTRRYMRRLVDAPDTATWMADRDGDLTGFAILEWAEQVSGVVGYIATIEVHPEWRGQGIGAALLQRLEDSAAGQNAVAIWLHVDADNAGAIRLYERSGYTYSGRAENFYARNRPAKIYVKALG